jgi:sensor histidine kinase YesM
VKLPFKNRTIKFSSPWIIALIPFFVTLIFTNEYFSKYSLKLISRSAFGKNLYYYNDLNNDGNSELIYFYTYQNAQIHVNNINNKLEEVYNLPGQWFNARDDNPVFFVGDANNDNFKEIYAFTLNSGDSLFISVIQHNQNTGKIQNRFVTILPKQGNNSDYHLFPLGLEDNNADESPEFIFVIGAGFPLQPRAVFAWDIKNDSIYRSPLMGALVRPTYENFYFDDIDGDSVKEIFFRTSAPDNYKESIPFSDNHAWVMVFTKNLLFLFEPIQIKGAQTEIYHFPYESGDSPLIGTFINNLRKGNSQSQIQIYNAQGIKLKESDIPELKKATSSVLIKKNNRYYVFSDLNNRLQISLLNNNLDKIIHKVVFNCNNYNRYFEDIDMDGEEEFILYNNLDERVTVLRSNLKTRTETNVSFANYASTFSISTAQINFQPNKFILTHNGVSNYLTYSRNPFYFFNFFFLIIYYFLLVFSFRLLRKSWLLNLQRKQQAEQEMQKLQMQTVLNQLNPHFTFNAINTVGADILNNEPQKAYDSLTRLSRLLRKSVDHAFVPYKTLGEEIDFLREYLEVEKSRFGDKLEYEITIQNDIDLQLKVPKMLIQLFVENAIKHGLFHKKDGGKIAVDISKAATAIKIVVADNGVGRQKAAELRDGRQGKGMLILRNYLRLFKEQFNREITFEIQDILEAGEVCGTRVEILIWM